MIRFNFDNMTQFVSWFVQHISSLGKGKEDNKAEKLIVDAFCCANQSIFINLDCPFHSSPFFSKNVMGVCLSSPASSILAWENYMQSLTIESE